jgi:hypothetical protein
MSNPERIQALTDKIDSMERELIAEIDSMLIEEGMNAFVLWANAFPKRHLRFISGMGTCTFACPTLDNNAFMLELDDYCDEECMKVNSRPRAVAMLQPMVDFIKLFWSSDFYQYPALPDIIYNPLMRVVECGDKVIYLDKES